MNLGLQQYTLNKLVGMTLMMKRIFLFIISLVSVPALLSAQAQINTRKEKIGDFTEKVTKVVISGNMFFDSALKEEIRNRWTASPYEFCTLAEFDSLKTDPDYYFLIKLKGQFRREAGPELEFLSLLKGGPEAEKGLDKMLDIVTFPYTAIDSPTGRETVYLPVILDIIQQHVLASTESDLVAYSSLGSYSNNVGHIRGKKILTTLDKYYLTDLGLGRIHNSGFKLEMGALLENVVYNELLNRGYEVYVGSIPGSEVDFVALKDGKKEYYQVAYYLYDQRVIEREFGVYANIPDNYPKYVISMDKMDFSREGVIHLNAIKFLSETV